MIYRKEKVKMGSRRVLLWAVFVLGALSLTACMAEVGNKGEPTMKSTAAAATVKKKDESAAKPKEPGSAEGSEEKEKVMSFD